MEKGIEKVLARCRGKNAREVHKAAPANISLPLGMAKSIEGTKTKEKSGFSPCGVPLVHKKVKKSCLKALTYEACWNIIMRSKLGNLAMRILQRHRTSCGVKTARKAVLVQRN